MKMRGITEERLKEVFSKLYWSRNDEKELFTALLSECTELNAWQPIETAPRDREILVYAPSYSELRCLKQIISYHDSAGYYIDELRYPTHRQELPGNPK